MTRLVGPPSIQTKTKFMLRSNSTLAELMWKSWGTTLQRIASTVPRNTQPFSAGLLTVPAKPRPAPKCIVIVERVSVKKVDLLNRRLGQKVKHIGASAAEPDDRNLRDFQLLRKAPMPARLVAVSKYLNGDWSSGMGMTRWVLADAA